jgi:hypothetical protein
MSDMLMNRNNIPRLEMLLEIRVEEDMNVLQSL